METSLAAPLELSAANATPGLCMLVVEDNEADAYLIQRVLSRHPMVGRVVRAIDGGMAEEMIARGEVTPNLAFIDLYMPRKNGFDLLMALAGRAERGFTMVVLTSSNLPTDGLRSRLRGAAQVIVKPDTVEQLEAVLTGAIDTFCTPGQSATGDQDGAGPLATGSPGGSAAPVATQAKASRGMSDAARTTDALRSTSRMAQVGGWGMDFSSERTSLSPELCALLDGSPAPQMSIADALGLWLEADRPALVRALDAVIEHGEPLTFEGRTLAPDGVTRWWRLVGEPDFVADRCVGLRGAAQDITRWRAEAGARSADMAADAMLARLATMSHEIRTPLNGVLGMAHVMAGDDLSGPQRQRLGVIAVSGEALLGLFDELVDVSLLAAGKLDLNWGVVDAQELADGARAAFVALSEGKSLQLKLSLAPSALGLWVGDSHRLRQIVRHLVSNAVKFTDAGSVSIEIACIDERLVIRVRDTGVGIAPEALPFVFDKFVQADDSLTRRHGGSGMGLTICRELLALMGGDIAVESTPGMGALVTVTLPARWVAAARQARQATMAGDAGLRVLVAEDNAVNRLVLEGLLAAFGIHPVMVEDGRQAVDAWRSGAWDALLMDIQMPVIDGLSATRVIRAAEREEGRPRTPIIAVTANTTPRQLAEYRAAGMDDCIPKPINPILLIQALEAVSSTMEGLPAGLGAGEAAALNRERLMSRLSGRKDEERGSARRGGNEMKPILSARLALATAGGANLLKAGSAYLRPGAANAKLLVGAIVAVIVIVAALDFWTSGELVASTLFILPLALCALQPSKRLLWTTAVAAALLTVAAGLWGENRDGISTSSDGMITRILLSASLFVLTAFIHLWLRKVRLGTVAATQISRQSESLAAQNEQLALLIAAGTRDVGERADAEIHLAQMEARYRGLLEAAPDAMVVVDQGGAIVLLNLQAEKQFGYHRDELVGLPVKNIIPEGFAERLIADGTRTAAEALAQQIGTGLELIGRRKDGSEFPMELMLSPLENADGILVTAAIRDVTARQADQQALRASEEWHRLAVEITEIGTWFWDITRNEITWSDQFRKMFGLTSDDPVSYEAIFQNVHQEDQWQVDRSIRNTLERDEPYDVEYRIIWPDGSLHWIASKGRVRRGPAGAPQTMQGTILDVTERKAGQESLRERPALERTSAELMRSNVDLQQFAYVAAHDLQEPLRMVSSYTQLLANRYKGRLDDKADEFIALAVDGAQRMQLLIADLLAYCQVGTAGQELCETSMDHALDLALQNLKGALDESGGVVTRGSLPVIVADHAQFVQLFQNLVGNALKYRAADPPRVHVSAKKNRAKEWVFSVSDNGLGIEPRHFEKIFMMFQRLHPREAFSGTGIGLSLCRKIVERHGGRIWVESASAEGSTFHVALPQGGV
ncbi:MAG: sensor signal transduction histidine kinase [Caulobacter sp.]|nr:sensor signal transduction histidine kinase [Caulobacter sp.]